MAPTGVQRVGKGAIAASITVSSADGWATPTTGNLLVVSSNGDFTTGAPTGAGTWTAGPSIIDGNGVYTWYKFSDGTESSITVSMTSGSFDFCITVAEYSGVLAFDAQNSTTVSGTSGTSTTSTSVTTTADGDLILAFALIHGASSSVPASPSWTNSFVDAVDANSGTPRNQAAYTFCGELLGAGTAGSYSTACSWTNSATDRQEIVLAFTPAATAAPVVAPWPVYAPGLNGPGGVLLNIPPITDPAGTSPPADPTQVDFTGYDAATATTANDPGTTVAFTGYDATPAAGAADPGTTVAFTAYDTSVAATANDPGTTVTFVAQDSTAALGVQDPGTTVAFTAYDATVSTAAITNAPAETTTASFVAQDPNVALNVNEPTNPSVTFVGYDAGGSAGAQAGQPVIAFTGYDAVSAVAPTDGGTTVAFTGYSPTTAVTVNDTNPTAAFTGYDATVSTTAQTSAPAEATIAAFTAYDAASNLTATDGGSLAAFSAQDATTALGVPAGQPAIAFTGYDSTIQTGLLSAAGTTTTAWSASDAAVATTGGANGAMVALTAYDATIVALGGVKPFLVVDSGTVAVDSMDAGKAAVVTGDVDQGFSYTTGEPWS